MIRLIQILCPQRHAIAAAAYDPDTVQRNETLRKLSDALNAERVLPICRICGSTELRVEEAPTRYATMEEATPHLEELARLNAMTGKLLGRLREKAQEN